MKVTLLIPALNEIGGMKEIMPRIQPDWYNQLIIVDGGSTDGTVEYAREQGYFVLAQKRKGLRHAYIEAMKHITGDIVITFSPDGNSIPELIPRLAEKMKRGYDMVIVSRYAQDTKSYDDDLITAFGNWMFTTLINLLHRGKYTDAMVMFRAWKKNIFTDLDLDKDSSYAFEERLFRTQVAVEPLLSIRAAKRKLKCADIPGDEPPRIGGERKLKIIQWGSAYLFEVLREIFAWRKGPYIPTYRIMAETDICKLCGWQLPKSVSSKDGVCSRCIKEMKSKSGHIWGINFCSRCGSRITRNQPHCEFCGGSRKYKWEEKCPQI